MAPMADDHTHLPQLDPDEYRVKPGSSVDLSKWSTNTTDGFDGDKAQAQAVLLGLNERLGQLQQLLYAQAEHKMLIVLQGMDTSGKGGTVRHVVGQLDPNGIRIKAFKAPTEAELAHDFLWRVRSEVPQPGQIGRLRPSRRC